MRKLSGMIICCISLGACQTGRPVLTQGTAGPSVYTRWVLKSLEDTTLQRQWRSTVVLVIGRDSLTSGHIICNTFNGHCTIDTVAHTLQFSRLASTWKACRESRTEAAYLDMLRSIDRYEQKGQQLFLYSKGKKQAIYDEAKRH